MNLIFISLIVLGVTGLAAAVLLYLIAQKFKVEEDPRIDEVQEVLPGANCGGCGFAGCRALAEACVKADSLDGLFCPVGGAPTMTKVGEILGMAAPVTEPKVAVVRCNGTCAARPITASAIATSCTACMVARRTAVSAAWVAATAPAHASLARSPWTKRRGCPWWTRRNVPPAASAYKHARAD